MNHTQQIAEPHERLAELMHMYGVRQVDICGRCDLKKSSVSCYVSGKKKMGSHVLETIAKEFDVSVDWLMGYDVPIVKRNREKEEKLNAFMNKYSVLKPEDRNIIDSLIDRMLENKNAESDETR